MPGDYFNSQSPVASLTAGLAAIFAPAPVLGKLDPEALLRVGNPPEGGHWSFELTIARSADRNGGDLTKPFEHAKIALLHEQQFPIG